MSNYYQHPHPNFPPVQLQETIQQLIYEQHRHRKELEEKIQALQEEQARLQAHIQSLKPIHIENINYKIQELTVKELKGTLNIGMTALSDAEELKKWLHNGTQDVEMENVEQQHTSEFPGGEGHP